MYSAPMAQRASAWVATGWLVFLGSNEKVHSAGGSPQVPSPRPSSSVASDVHASPAQVPAQVDSGATEGPRTVADAVARLFASEPGLTDGWTVVGSGGLTGMGTGTVVIVATKDRAKVLRSFVPPTRKAPGHDLPRSAADMTALDPAEKKRVLEAVAKAPSPGKPVPPGGSDTFIYDFAHHTRRDKGTPLVTRHFRVEDRGDETPALSLVRALYPSTPGESSQ